MVLRHPRPKLVLSLTPLIDVVFILLIFFMLASQFVDWRQIKLTPQAQLSGEVSDEQTSELRLSNDGSFLVNGQVYEKLSAVVHALKTEGHNTTIFLEPEGEVEVQYVVDVIEGLSGAGLHKVQLSEAEEQAPQ